MYEHDEYIHLLCKESMSEQPPSDRIDKLASKQSIQQQTHDSNHSINLHMSLNLSKI